MKPILRSSSLTLRLTSPPRITFPRRCLHALPPNPATVKPIAPHGPPPSAPVEHTDIRVARKRKQADLLQRGLDLKSGLQGGNAGNAAKLKRFWKEVHVKKTDNAYHILLDTRPIKMPDSRILAVPLQKPHLASAIALEWDLLVTSQQALKTHLIPLTSLTSRALEIAKEDSDAKPESIGPIRKAIVKDVMAYLDTDSLLCWAPTPSQDPPGYEDHESRKAKSLRQIQQETAIPIIQYLIHQVWPGIKIIPVLDDNSIIPKKQPEGTREIIQGWISNLGAWDLAGLERAVLASKSLLTAVRFVVEWSRELRGVGGEMERSDEDNFGVEEATRVTRMEVEWQTRMWGEVEDTHDVEKEDVRRQFGSVVLLVAGEKEYF